MQNINFQSPRTLLIATGLLFLFLAIGAWWQTKNPSRFFPSPSVSGTPASSPTPDISPNGKTNLCFSSTEMPPLMDLTGWPGITNYSLGFVVWLHPQMRLDREASLETGGIEAFKITTPTYPQGAILRAVDLRFHPYTVLAKNERLAYNVENDSWVSLTRGACEPNRVGTTVGRWPVFLVDRGTETKVDRTYIVVHPKTPDADEKRFPVAVEYTIVFDRNALSPQVREQADAFLRALETTIRTTRFFVPE